MGQTVPLSSRGRVSRHQRPAIPVGAGVEPKRKKPVCDRRPGPVHLWIPRVGRPLLCPPGRELPGYAFHPPVEKLPLHAGDPALRAPGHLGKRRIAAAFEGTAPQRSACALCHGGERPVRGDLHRQGDQPHGGRHRYAGQRRRVLPCGGCAAAQFLRHRRFIPYPPAGRPGGKMPPPGGDSLCDRRARRLLGG